MAPTEGRPIEDLQARDLAWISDFITQQVAIMMHPMMDHLEQTDEAGEYTQRAVERLGSDIAELRGDLQRTNKYLGILRQGLGMQGESRCAMQRNLESNTRTVGRVESTMETLVDIVRRVEDRFGQITHDMRGVDSKQSEMAKQLTDSSASIEDLHAKMESISIDNHTLKDDLRTNEARMEAWQRDLRELRRSQLGIAPKFEDKLARQQLPASQDSHGVSTSDTWPPKKSLAASTSVEIGGKDCSTPESGEGDQKLKRVGSSLSNSRRGLMQSEIKLSTLPSRSSSQALLYDRIQPGPETDDAFFSSHPSNTVADDSTPSSRLPLLARQHPLDSSYNSGVRLRFSETLTRQASRGSLT